MRSLQINKLLNISWALLWFVLPVSQRATVLMIWVFGMLILIRTVTSKVSITRSDLFMTILFLLFFFVQALSLILYPGNDDWVKLLERKSAFLVIPILMLAGNSLIEQKEKWAIRGFVAGLMTIGVYLFMVAIVRTVRDWDVVHWFYHGFTDSSYLGAIYYSWYLSAALIYLAYRQRDEVLEMHKKKLMLILLALLLLSSSKLFIVLTIVALLPLLIRSLSTNKGRTVKVWLYVIFLVLLSIPFFLRLEELRNTDFNVVNKDEYRYDTPFNGITIRLVQWRFGIEILDEDNAWIMGTGIAGSQERLNAKYVEYGVYTGNPDLGDQGYLDYNFHNQYIETLVGTGCVGLSLLLLILISIFVRARSRLLFPLPVYLITGLFFMTESVLERQAGIVFFVLIACTLLEQNNTKSQPVGSRS
jgi:O-antigen ligase